MYNYFQDKDFGKIKMVIHLAYLSADIVRARNCTKIEGPKFQILHNIFNFLYFYMINLNKIINGQQKQLSGHIKFKHNLHTIVLSFTFSFFSFYSWHYKIYPTMMGLMAMIEFKHKVL
jgi:hypothetical protein